MRLGEEIRKKKKKKKKKKTRQGSERAVDILATVLQSLTVRPWGCSTGVYRIRYVSGTVRDSTEFDLLINDVILHNA